MPTTPNYGWDTPADTDYVTNGALSIRTMANDADATVKSVDDAKVDKAGDLMTGALTLPVLQMLQDGSSLSEITSLDPTGTTLRGAISFISNNQLKLFVASNSNDLTIDNAGNTTRTSATRVRPIAFAMAVGEETIAANSSTTVTFPSFRFQQRPNIQVTPYSTSATVVTGHAGNASTSGFTLYNTDNQTRTFAWQAVQMTFTNTNG
jgi:hypothetical protein